MRIFLVVAILLVTSSGLYAWMTAIRSYEGTRQHALAHVVDVTPEAWARLNNKRIFFGHHSVGNNILDGIHGIVVAHLSPGLRIVQTKDASLIGDGVLAHAAVGRNFDPMSKIAAFESLIDSGVGEKVDIAFFKLCFVDVGRDSDPDAIFAAYCASMERLKLRHPNTVFMHVTVPLGGPPNTVKGVLKASVKRLFGRPPVLEENRVRARYNALLRERFAENEPLFDLARYETLGPEGQRHYGMWKGEEVPILSRIYTDDGGHLNVVGRRHVAEQLLIKLATLAEASR